MPPCVILRITSSPGGRNVFLYVHVTVSPFPSTTEVSPVSRSVAPVLVLFADTQLRSVSVVYAGNCSRKVHVDASGPDERLLGRACRSRR